MKVRNLPYPFLRGQPLKQQNAYLNFKEEEIMEAIDELKWLLQRNCLSAIEKNKRNLYITKIDQPDIVQWPRTFRFNFVLYYYKSLLVL